MNPIYPSTWKRSSVLVALAFVLLSYSVQAQTNLPNTRPTVDPIPDYTTQYSADTRFIELNGITPGEETDQTISIDVSTEDKDLIESISADVVDNGKAYINYRLKAGAAGSAKIKVVITDNGSAPSSVTRTFHIITEALNHELPAKAEEINDHQLKAYPNPVLLSSRISFSTPNDEQLVAVDLFTLSGTKVKQLFTGSTLAQKSYYVDVNSKNLAAGVYIVRLTAASHTENLKLVVSK